MASASSSTLSYATLFRSARVASLKRARVIDRILVNQRFPTFGSETSTEWRALPGSSLQVVNVRVRARVASRKRARVIDRILLNQRFPTFGTETSTEWRAL